jgi:hypothetical protein
MFEVNKILLGNRNLLKLKNNREINDLLRKINDLSPLFFQEKTYNDILFNEMLKRDTYVVPIYDNSHPVIIFITSYHNIPSVFLISLQVKDLVYMIPMNIDTQITDTILYGEYVLSPNLFIHIERLLYKNGRKMNMLKYDKQLEMMSSIKGLWSSEWILPKPVYSIYELEELNKMNKLNTIGYRFYSFTLPVVFYKNKNMLYIRSISRHLEKIYSNKKEEEQIKIYPNTTAELLLDMSNKLNKTYGIYHIFNKDGVDMGILRLRTFEEHNDLSSYTSKYSHIYLKLRYDESFNKWTLLNNTFKDSIVKAC